MIKNKVFKSNEKRKFEEFMKKHEVIRVHSYLRAKPYSQNREEFTKVYYKEEDK